MEGGGRGWRGSECAPRKNTMALLAVTTTSQGEPNPTPPSHPIPSSQPALRPYRLRKVLVKGPGERVRWEAIINRGTSQIDQELWLVKAGRQAGFSDPRCQNERRSPDLRIANAVTIAGQRKRGERMAHQRHSSVPSIVWGRAGKGIPREAPGGHEEGMGAGLADGLDPLALLSHLGAPGDGPRPMDDRSNRLTE